VPNLAIFASGTGSNARKIVEHFKDHPDIQVRLIVSNKPTAPVLGLGSEYGLDTLVLDRETFYQTDDTLATLRAYDIDLIVLAGFLWLVPATLVAAFPQRIINIHPALLPKYGGKGMYGMHVHRAVWDAGEKESGITIHYVNEHYDEGDIIFQARCALSPRDRPEDIAAKVRQLEHQYFAPTIEQLLKKTNVF